MAQQKTEVIFTMNGTAATRTLQLMQAEAERLAAELQQMDSKSPKFKEAQSALKTMQSAMNGVKADIDRVGNALDNLGNTSLGNLRRALAGIKKERDKLTSSSDDLKRAEELNAQAKKIYDEIRLISGEYVKIEDGLSSIQKKSDQWLDKAISQQRNLLHVTERETQEYEEQSQILAKLQAEQDRRSVRVDKSAFAPNAADYNKAKSIAGGSVQSPDNTSRTPTKKELQWSKDYLTQELNNTQTSEVAKIESIKRAIAQVDEQMKVYANTTEKAVMSETKLADVLNNIKTSSLDELRDASAALKKKLDSLSPSSAEAKKIKDQLVLLDKEIKQVEIDIVNVDEVLSRSRKGKASVDELRKAYKQLQTELAGINTGSERFREGSKELEELRRKIEQVTGAANKQTNAWQTAARNLTAYVGMFAMFNKAKELIPGVIHKNLEYSSSLTDIRKVSGLAMADINQLSTELAKIDTRTSVDGLAQLAYSGAKLGMGQYGVEGMAGFVRAADKINVAIGEEMGDDALPALAKLVETMGLIPRMGIEKALDATGSAMFKLSSTSTATSGNIVEFAKRLTGVSRTAGITADQLLALGSASDAMYLMPEVSSTAMSKFIVALQKNHNLIEEDLNIQKGTIKEMYAAGNIMDAIVLVLEKMKEKGNMNVLGDIFKDFDSDGQRLVSSMVTMSKNVDMLKDHLHTSKEAFDEATAVTAEYEMQQNSALGILERANNLWEKAFVNPDGVENVKDMTQAWYDISQTILQSPLYNGSLHAAITALTLSIKGLVAILPLLINYFVAFGAAKTWSLLANVFVKVQEAWVQFRVLSQSIGAATAAQTAFNVATKGHPLVALAGAIMTVVGVAWSYVSASREAAAAQEEAARRADEWKNRANEAQQETDTLTRKLNTYKTTLEELNLSQSNRNKTIRQFNSDFRQYISKLGIEIKNVSDLKRHYSELSQEIQRATYYRLREEAKKDVMPGYQKSRLAAANRIKEELSNLEGNEITQGRVMDWFRKGAGADWIYRQIITNRAAVLLGDKVAFNGADYSYFNYEKGKRVKGNKVKLLSALRYYQNATKRETAKNKEIDDYFNAIVNLDGYHPWVDDNLGTLDNEAGGKSGKGGDGGRSGAVKKEENAAKTRANALIANIKAFYEEQKRKYIEWVAKMNAEGEKVSEGQQNMMLNQLDARMNAALGTARQSIADLNGGWQDFYKSMSDDIVIESDETSKALLQSIGKADVEELHKLFSKLSGDLSRENNKTLSENLGALLDQIFANGSAELKKAAQKVLEHQRDIQKIISENDYTGAVNRETRSNFDTLGFLRPAEGLKGDTTADLEIMNAAFDRLTEKARGSVAALYDLDPAADDFREKFLQYLAVANSGFDFTLLNGQELKALYIELIKYTDNYTEAEKKTYDRAKKITDQMWAVNQRHLESQRALTELQTKSSMYGTQTNFWSNLGAKDNRYDPEIESMRLKMQMAEEYYFFLLRNSKNKQLLEEADQARQEAELNYANQMATAMKSRLSQMQSLVNPIVDFGEAMGEAFATMAHDAESADEAIKNAIKSMLQSWGKMVVNSVNSQMWQAINNGGVKNRQQKAQSDIKAARISAEQDAKEDAAPAPPAANSSVPTAQQTTPAAGIAAGTRESNPAYVYVVNGQPGGATAAANNIAPTANVTSAAAPGVAAASTATPGAAVGTPDANAIAVPDTDTAQGGVNAPKASSAVRGAANVAGAAGSAAAGVASGDGTWENLGASVAGTAMNTLLTTPFIGGKSGSGKSDKEKSKADKKEIKEAKKQQKALTDVSEKGVKERTEVNEQGISDITAATKQGGDDQSGAVGVAQDAIVAATQTGLSTVLTSTIANNQAVTTSNATTTTANTSLSLVGAVAKCFEFLGPIAGPIAAATVTATLMGLLSWGLNAAFSSGSDSSSTASTPNTKLKTGMLTYDSGNVQDLKPYVGDNGELYWAKEETASHRGVNLLTQPTATKINGQNALVAENGPELVIGRETTKAMMMNNPALLKTLVQYDANYSGRRAFDQGNVSEMLGAYAAANAQQSNSSASANDALLQAVNALVQRLNQPINAQINMYGRGNLYDSMTKANQFMGGKA